MNVVYNTKGTGSVTHRSMLLPHALINCTQIHHDKVYSIISFKPYPALLLASPNQKELFGVEAAGKEKQKGLEEFIAQFHTAREKWNAYK